MVSKAREDLPEPESPVTTISFSRGILMDMFFKLCTRAPCTSMWLLFIGEVKVFKSIRVLGCWRASEWQTEV